MWKHDSASILVLKARQWFSWGRETVRFLLVMVSGIRMICHQIPSVSADTRLAFPHPQVVAGRRAFKKSEIIGVVPAEGQPHSSTQRACPLLAKMQTGDFIDFNLLLVPGCWQPPTTASMLSDGWKELSSSALRQPTEKASHPVGKYGGMA